MLPQLRRVLCYWFLVVASQVEEWQKYVVGISEPNRKFILLKTMAMCRSPEIPSDVPAPTSWWSWGSAALVGWQSLIVWRFAVRSAKRKQKPFEPVLNCFDSMFIRGFPHLLEVNMFVMIQQYPWRSIVFNHVMGRVRTQQDWRQEQRSNKNLNGAQSEAWLINRNWKPRCWFAAQPCNL